MCGITGIWELGGEPVDFSLLRRMTSGIIHRGPDGEGYWMVHPRNGQHWSWRPGEEWPPERGYSLGLGHRRLAIIDLTESGHQPMPCRNGVCWVVYNGEIYNYIELRQELEALGHRFRSTSDTEVLLAAYRQWGLDCFRRFNGMWALGLWDGHRRKLLLSRDRFGVKPLYYTEVGNRLLFASEIKALLADPQVSPQPDDQAIYDYLARGYGYVDLSERTFFRGITQVRPAHVLEVGPEGLREHRYWDLEPREVASRGRSDTGLAEEFLDLLRSAVALRLRSDVPVAISLSGGLDSSAITCLADQVTCKGGVATFSSCFEEPAYDERPYIHRVLDEVSVSPTFVFPSGDSLFENIERVIWHQDEPYAGLSIYAQWFVMEAAHQKGFKVILTGQGGDEGLAGYHKYYPAFFADSIRTGRWVTLLRELVDFRRVTGGAVYPALGQALRLLASHWLPRRKARKLSGQPPYLSRNFADRMRPTAPTPRRFSSCLNDALYRGFTISPLPSLLRIEDRNGMAHSVEARSPFMDYRLVEFLFSLPPEQKIQKGYTKRILREACRGVVPETVLARPDKMGFVTPMGPWFRSDLRQRIAELLAPKVLSQRGYLDPGRSQAAFQAHCSGQANLDFTIWSWVNLELWFRIFIDREGESKL
ncbi:asparagine synthase (glutamine-hydrolyzing) [Nitrospinae bacterium AH_259_B05_G02_I21]|nr:asparagine synthase (glutamine-hydrolyzing) [Nitrospinae bacterium AH_259_B05_G02_I21]MDA2931922.1 asparagine synthase (glutamine-hydrolyzing) [Nitrospinae bacterium AH-259-F20]